MDGVRFLKDPQRITETAKDATAWVNEAIELVRNAAEPNPWKMADDEEIAGAILEKIEATKTDKQNRRSQ